MPEPARTVDETLRRAVRGDPTARAALVERLRPAVWSLCARLDPEPEDACQEAWERILAGLAGFDPDGEATVVTWACRIAYRRLVDRHRRRGVRGDVIALEREPAVEPTAEGTLAAGRRSERLEAAIERLPWSQRRVVVMHHLHETSVEELSRIEGVPVGTIKSRLHRGRAALLRWMGDAP